MAIRRQANLSHQVAQELGKSIVRGAYATGEPFPTEAELCEFFGVSRTAVREAVKMLSAKGLLSSKPRQGITILPEEDWNILDPALLLWSLEGRPTRKVLREFFQMRIAIEPEAASLAARGSRPDAVEEIASALRRMETSRANSSAARAADVDFHVAILYATGNRFYIRMRDFIATALNVSIRFTTPRPEHYGAAVGAHSGIYEAIAAGDAAAARNRMHRLISEAERYLAPARAVEKA